MQGWRCLHTWKPWPPKTRGTRALRVLRMTECKRHLLVSVASLTLRDQDCVMDSDLHALGTDRSAGCEGYISRSALGQNALKCASRPAVCGCAGAELRAAA